MEPTLLFLAACLMFSGVHGGSESMSCSMVNGKTICSRQTGSGNVAMSSSQSSTGFGPDYQSTYAGTGGQNQWDSTSQTVGGPGGYNNPGGSNTQGSYGQYGGPSDSSSYSSSYSSSSPNSGYAGPQGGGAFAGGFAVAGPFFPGPAYPPQDTSSQSGGAPAQGYAPVMPSIAAGPMNFVQGFMNGGFRGGAFAGAGAVAVPFFGRR